jgi:hypothetical protein
VIVAGRYFLKFEATNFVLQAYICDKFREY